LGAFVRLDGEGNEPGERRWVVDASGLGVGGFGRGGAAGEKQVPGAKARGRLGLGDAGTEVPAYLKRWPPAYLGRWPWVG
jgi:hypothetical protein